MWTDPDLRAYSFWVHFFMSTCVGLTMIAVGLFLWWRSNVIQVLVKDIEGHMRAQNVAVRKALDNQETILGGQREAAELLRHYK